MISDGIQPVSRYLEHQGSEMRLQGDSSRSPDEAAGAGERAGRKLERKEARALVGAGQRERAGRLGREAEARVVGRVPDEEHGAVAERLRPRERLADEG